MAGLSKVTTAAEVNTRLGTLARAVHVAMEDIEKGRQFLAQNDDQELVRDYQMDPNDIAELRAAFDDLALLARIYRGQQAPPSPQNFRQHVRRIIGLGFL